MTDQLTTRVSKLEIVQSNQSNEIHQINEKVGHIERDMNDLKSITKSNTLANTQTSDKLSDIYLIMHEFKGGWRVVKWVAGGFITLIGLSLTILTILQVIQDGS
jgi:uncharacterized coiled-coil protein SlyX